MNFSTKINNGGESICGKGNGGLKPSKIGPNDDPSACGDCSANGNVHSKKSNCSNSSKINFWI